MLQKLRYFHALSNFKTISHAAEKLQTTQSNLSQAIINLENKLDLVLLNRSNRGISFTPEGYLLLNLSHNILNDVQQVTNLANNSFKNQLSISTSLFLLNNHLLKKTYDFYDGELTLTIHEELLENVFAAVAEMKTEIGIIQLNTLNKKAVLALADYYQLELELISTTPWHANIKQDHPLAKKGRLSFIDLRPYPIIRLPKNSYSFLPPDNLIIDKISLDDFEKVIYLNYSNGIIGFLQNSQAFYLSSSLYQADFNAAGIKSIPLSSQANRLKIAWLKKKDHPSSLEASLFIRMLKESLT